MRFLLSDEVQIEGYAKLLNLTTRADMVDNNTSKPSRWFRTWRRR